jgi:hypothetical protein
VSPTQGVPQIPPLSSASGAHQQVLAWSAVQGHRIAIDALKVRAVLEFVPGSKEGRDCVDIVEIMRLPGYPPDMRRRAVTLDAEGEVLLLLGPELHFCEVVTTTLQTVPEFIAGLTEAVGLSGLVEVEGNLMFLFDSDWIGQHRTAVKEVAR